LRALGVEVEGIFNAVDFEAYNPETSSFLPAAFSPRKGDLAGKAICKRHFLKYLKDNQEMGSVKVYGQIDNWDLPLTISISRMAREKGLATLAVALNILFSAPDDPGFRFLLMVGHGDQELREQFIAMARNHHGKFCLLEGHSAEIATMVYSAGEIFVNPAHTEPCGLTETFGIAMGCIPVVHFVDGLRKIRDGIDGITYVGGSSELVGALGRAIHLYRDPMAIRLMILNGINGLCARLAPDKVVARYLETYGRTIASSRDFEAPE